MLRQQMPVSLAVHDVSSAPGDQYRQRKYLGGRGGVGESPDGDVRQVSVFAMSWGSDGAVAVYGQRFA